MNENIDAQEKKDLPSNFIRDIIDEHNLSGRFGAKVHTRFPPEPNGYLHIGHAKSICLNFGLAKDYNGATNLRFDDTNPVTEDVEYVDSIREDVKWLGFDWEDREFYASDYFDRMYELAEILVEKGLAYIDSLTPEEIRHYRGWPTSPGKESPYRNRSVEENLDLFRRMKTGEFNEGDHILRAKIDMSSPNMNMRDPAVYRIKKSSHHRTKDKWCIYPMYDYAHCLSDSFEGITHSICTLEFENHRPLYDWFLDKLELYHPQQIEFARLNLSYTVMSKRKLLFLVKEKYVDGWDDPRMPTISGLRRRGYTPSSIRDFAEKVGVARRDNVIDVAVLEHSIRNDLNKHASRYMAVINPIKLTIINYPENDIEYLEAVNNPEDSAMGMRKVPFSRHLFIERDDFREDPPKKFHRLFPGSEVRLRYAYIIICTGFKKNDISGEIDEIYCEYYPDTKSGGLGASRKVKGTIHWVSASHAGNVEARLYDRLFNHPDPLESDDDAGGFLQHINPDSLKIVSNCKVEPELLNAKPGDRFQFERVGYFCADTKLSTSGNPVFNRTVTLKDTWAKIENQTNNQ
ncbi:MAG: glutamine--tRNA ligase/YqeY domain fusion protein [Ignavibacteriales bacterium]|nr:glutamine--tRNA ligase/YqeY domain fusion protein [Ignavibacteriales bacterium]